MRAAGIVADHSAQCAAAVCRWVRAKRELIFLRAIPQRVQNDARLDSCELPCDVDLQDLVHVLRKVQNHRDVASLPGKASARTARQDRRAILPARGYRCDHIVFISWYHQADGNLPVIRAIGRIESAASTVKAYFALDDALKFFFEFAGLRESIHGLTVRTQRERRNLYSAHNWVWCVRYSDSSAFTWQVRRRRIRSL